MQMTVFQYPDKPSRFFVDGERVSKRDYGFIDRLAKRHDCMITRSTKNGYRHDKTVSK